jgi:hypothetical protein
MVRVAFGVRRLAFGVTVATALPRVPGVTKDCKDSAIRLDRYLDRSSAALIIGCRDRVGTRFRRPVKGSIVFGRS